MPKETWATGAGKPPRKVTSEADMVRELRAGADLHTVDSKVVKAKTGRTKKKGE